MSKRFLVFLALILSLEIVLASCIGEGGGGDDGDNAADDTQADDDTGSGDDDDTEPDDDTISDDDDDDDDKIDCKENCDASASSVSHSKPQNTPDKAIDNNYLTWWENTTQVQHPEACYSPQWLAVKMDKNYWVSAIGVYWGADMYGNFEYGTNFDVYVNDRETPEKMPHEVPEGEWADYGYTLVQHIEQLEGQDKESNLFDLSGSPVNARWIFLALYESNAVGILQCDGNDTYSFEVAELEIFGSDER